MSYKGFRSWIGARLLGTQYATIRIDDRDIDAVAKKLGVDADLLLEVRAQAIIDLHARGLAQPISNNSKKSLDEANVRLYQYQIWFPVPVFEAWRLECDRRGAHPATFLRSLIHHYLLGRREPVPLNEWVWEGKLLRPGLKDRLAEKAVIPHGAKRALLRRATLRGTRPTPIVRALIIGAMRGEYQSVPLVTSGMMYDDESRYYTGETRSP